nr:hypothetical protein BaRGS_017186 [Batillaria attramentaria]
MPAPPQQAPVKQVIQLPPQLDQRLGMLEEQMVKTFRALNWIMQSMEANSLSCDISVPTLPDPKKQNDEEKTREKERQRAMKKQVKMEVDKRADYEDYDPVEYTSDQVLANPLYADSVNLIALAWRVVLDAGFLRVCNNSNWWKYDEKGKCVVLDGKPVLEFIAVKRADNKMWAIPGAITLPGEQCWDILTKYFTLEALGSLMDDPKLRQDIERRLYALSKKGQELYKGYADDARNTDNAWLGQALMLFHG